MAIGNTLSVICPKCRASVGGRCLEPIKDGSQYIDTVHKERVIEAEAPTCHKCGKRYDWNIEIELYEHEDDCDV